MQYPFADPYSPLYALAVVSIVALCARAAVVCIPFYAREVAAEGTARLTPIDGLRGVLCFSVMCCHAAVTFEYLQTGQWNPPRSLVYAFLGQTSVALFFCITAFLFWGRVVAREGRIGLFSLFRGRAFRLIPLYAVSCLLAVGVVALRYPQNWFSIPILRDLSKMALLGLRPWDKLGITDLNTINAGVVWSLQYEWGFYVFLPIGALIIQYGRTSWMWIVFLVTFAVSGPGPTMFFFPGILAVYVLKMPRVVDRLKGSAASVPVMLCCVALPLVTGNAFGLRALALTTGIFLPIACGNRLFGILTSRGLRLCGVISYSVYLLHGIVLCVAQPLLAQLRHNRPNVVWQYWLAIMALTIVTLVIGLITYRFVEWPCIQFERKRREKPNTPNHPANPLAIHDNRSPPDEIARSIAA